MQVCSAAEEGNTAYRGSSSPRGSPGEHRDPPGAGSSYESGLLSWHLRGQESWCPIPLPTVGSPGEHCAQERRDQAGRQAGDGVAACSAGCAGRMTTQGRDIPLAKCRHVKSTSSPAPFCSHLHGSRALIPPDSQGRKVGTHLRAKAAALMGNLHHLS